jgi:DNA-binding beta-propeller fold protein YncE
MTPITLSPPSTIGAWGNKGRGFAHPVDIATDARTGALLVLNRSTSWASPHGGAVRVTVLEAGHQEVLGEISGLGTSPGELMMPVGIAVDRRGRVFVTDEHSHTVSVFELDGTFLHRWGALGSGPGQLCRPAGIATEGDTVWVVDSGNSRLTRFTADGRPLVHVGGPGCGPGQLREPWFVAVDTEDGSLWVTDWGNNRVQVFGFDGTCRRVLGSSDGDLFLRPSGIARDATGNVYVADWGRDRVVVLDPDLRHVDTWFGNSTLSPWAIRRLTEFPEMAAARELTGDPGAEPLFRRPTGLCSLPDGHVLVADTARHRIQVYPSRPLS